MAKKTFAYYNVANKLAIIQLDDSDNEYKSSIQDIPEGLELRYTVQSGGTSNSSGTGEIKDELTELDLNRYQANAIVYYIKGKLAEDIGDIEKREFFMREFKRQIEKAYGAFKGGPYIIQGFKEMR